MLSVGNRPLWRSLVGIAVVLCLPSTVHAADPDVPVSTTSIVKNIENSEVERGQLVKLNGENLASGELVTVIFCNVALSKCDENDQNKRAMAFARPDSISFTVPHSVPLGRYKVRIKYSDKVIPPAPGVLRVK